MNIYDVKTELSENLQSLKAMLDSGEIDQATFSDTLSAIDGDFKDKAFAMWNFCESMDAEAEAIKEAAKRMTDRAKAKRETADTARAALLKMMDDLGMRSIEWPEFTLSINKKPPKLVIDDQSKISFEFFKTGAPTLDKVALKKHMKDHEVEGAHLESGEYLKCK